MRRIVALLLTGLLLSVGRAQAGAPETVRFAAADGVEIFGDWYGAPDAKAVVLLFHQAGSNRGEYTPIAPRLVEHGYAALAIDQRSGGRLFGRGNDTVAKLGRSTDYLAARADLEAALAWARARAPGRRILLCGSSYSAALVFLVAARHPDDVAGLLAFSPGEYLGSDDSVHRAAAMLHLPIFVTSASAREEIEATRSILAASPSPSKTQFVPTKGGVHGASTLREDRNPQGASSAWDAVFDFLDRCAKARSRPAG